VLLACLAVAACRDAPPEGNGSIHTAPTASVGSGGSGGGAGGSGGGSGGSGAYGPEATIVHLGEPGKVLLQGWVITPDESFDGEVLIDGALIACVAASCADHRAAADASVVHTGGIIMPGMIDTHNHILFNIFDEDDWVPQQPYGNHNQWPNEARYGALVDTKQYLNGESGSPLDLGCELLKYGELKGLIAGTTSIVGAANPGNRTCYRSLARTIDQTANGLCGTEPPQSCDDKIQAHTLFPSTASADGVCTNFGDGDTEAYLIHAGEGVDQSALGELASLETVTTEDGCLIDARTTVVHGTAFGAPQLDILAAAGMGISWSPRSNVFLYGSGTDLSKTTDVPLALSKGIRVALSPDWSLGGSQNLLDELRFASSVDEQEWGGMLSPEMLAQMVTNIPADLLALGDRLGTLAVGYRADVVVLGGNVAAPYQALLAATPRDIRLVFVDGIALYGDDQLAPLGPSSPACEAFDICTRAKFACVARPSAVAGDKLDQTFSEIESALATALESYDAMDLSQWDFSPLAPLVKCP
jgi:cytosine/adenosine deaminase-related metal-dependent hydrolase